THWAKPFTFVEDGVFSPKYDKIIKLIFTQEKSTSSVDEVLFFVCLAMSYSPRGNPQVPSALEGLTVVFEMGTSVTPPPSPPDDAYGCASVDVATGRGGLSRPICINFRRYVPSKLDNNLREEFVENE